MRLPWHRTREARQRAASAQREVETSRHRLEDTRQRVVMPLQAAAAKNGFAEIIRTSLVAGYRKGRQGES